jgi:hypothetical protein
LAPAGDGVGPPVGVDCVRAGDANRRPAMTAIVPQVIRPMIDLQYFLAVPRIHAESQGRQLRPARATRSSAELGNDLLSGSMEL